ncbi:MAG: serine/threonine-protein kinase [Leptothrix sp. (in: b-proteobacteria)]
MPHPLPAKIGPYPIQRLIGSGAMGLVYLGHDPAINRPVAIKTIHRQLLTELSSDDNTADRFRIEAQAAGRLHHPGIVSIYQFGEDHDCAYIAMEYVDGHNLSDYLAKPTRFSREDVLCLMQQLLEALDFAHANGVVHRDIKPANLLISREGRLKITDFGIARLESTQLTRANMIVGSPGFMAPEQYRDEPLDGRVDIFSAGVLLYHLLSGKMPFSGSNDAVMYKVMHEPPEPLPPNHDGRDFADFWPVILAALAKDPRRRYPDARAMQAALAGLVRDLPVERLLAVTCVMPMPGREPPAPQRAPSGTASHVTPHPLTLPTGWNEATLSGLEHDLARHVGPIAKVVVRKAARHFATLEAVRLDVAQSISNPTERQHFMQETQALIDAPLAAPRPGTHGTPRVSAFGTNISHQTGQPSTRQAKAIAGAQLDVDDLERVGAMLTRVIGPIAKILIRRCAAQSRHPDEFLELLLAQLGQQVDVAALRLDLLKLLH